MGKDGGRKDIQTQNCSDHPKGEREKEGWE